MANPLKKYINQHLSYRIIFFIDFMLSVLSSVVVLLGLNYYADSCRYQGTFAWAWLAGAVAFTLVGMLVFKGYKVIVRHTTLHDLIPYLGTLLVKDLLLGVLICICAEYSHSVFFALACDLLLSLFFFVIVRLLMFIAYDIFKRHTGSQQQCQRVLICGTTEKSAAAYTRLQNSPHYKVVGFLSQEINNKNLRVSDCPVYVFTNENQLEQIINRNDIHCLLFATEADLQGDNAYLIDFCAKHRVKALIIPTIDEVVGGEVMKNKVREVKIEDLLGRPEIKISMDEIKSHFADKVVLVTGAAGSIGSELCRQLATFGIRKLVLFDNGETPMHNLRLELENRFPDLDFAPVIGDVRQAPRLDFAFREHHPQVVFHAAAYKHVPLMEENPCEAVLVNVAGSRNVADKCIEYGVEEMVMISTDKAVNPTNVMGCTKRLAEIYVQSLGLAIAEGRHEGRTKFVTTRFGNVLGSNGSVIPRFREQIAKGGPLTVTHPDITRFFMTIPEACRLVMEAATMSVGNEIFVFDMGESVKIDDLARRMIKLAGLEVGKDIEIKYTGLRPGEKLYEEVLSDKENTQPTRHERIRIAKVREYDHQQALSVTDRLTDLSFQVDIPDMIKLMKETVPEYKSKNSRFEIYDK